MLPVIVSYQFLPSPVTLCNNCNFWVIMYALSCKVSVLITFWMPFYSCFFGFVRLVGTDKPFYLSISQFLGVFGSFGVSFPSRSLILISQSDIICLWAVFNLYMHNSFIIFVFWVLLFRYPDQSLICAVYLKPWIQLPLVSYPIYYDFFYFTFSCHL